MDVGNLISDSSAFSKATLNIWKFSVHILLKPSLENFEHYFASMWNECNVWQFEHSLTFPFFGNGMKTELFQSFDCFWVFQIVFQTEYSTLIASSFRIWNSSAGISSPLLALFILMLSCASLVAQTVKNLGANAEDTGSIPVVRWSPGKGDGYPWATKQSSTNVS